jgi:hypothetical protein
MSKQYERLQQQVHNLQNQVNDLIEVARKSDETLIAVINKQAEQIQFLFKFITAIQNKVKAEHPDQQVKDE